MPSKPSTECLNGNHRYCSTDGCPCVCHPGNEQDDLFAQDGLDLKEAGMQQALEHALDEWKDRFRATVTHLANTGLPFTSETVIAEVGLPTSQIASNANNAVGAMMNGLSRKRVIRKTGRRVLSKRASSHGAELTEWEGAR
jgi:hypothetical protein